MNYLNKHIIWKNTNNPLYPEYSLNDNMVWKIRVNDFPEEPLYTLLINDSAIIDFDDWPENWDRSKSLIKLLLNSLIEDDDKNKFLNLSEEIGTELGIKINPEILLQIKENKNDYIEILKNYKESLGIYYDTFVKKLTKLIISK